jgi:hypothetical protein
MINLFIGVNLSELKSTPICFPIDRCLTEYIMDDLKERFSSLGQSEIEELKKMPCIFADEGINKDAYIGNIVNITERDTNVMIEYRVTGETIRIENNNGILPLLDSNRWEMNRTHWTIKKVDIEQIRPYFRSSIGPKPTVFISYCWTPPENQRKVFHLVDALEKDGISVIYDKKNLRAGQDINYFMEQSIKNREIDKVLVVCNKDYMEKANSRQGGAGYEAGIILSEIQYKPLQTRVIPVVIETDEKYKPFLPTFLWSRTYVDLTRENGYAELVAEIKIISDDNTESRQS